MPGDALGQVPQRPGAQPGGFALRVNGLPVGVRDNVNFQDTPGLAWAGVDDVANARVNVTPQFFGEVILARQLNVDMTALGATAIVAALGVQLAAVTRVIYRLTAVAAFVAGPTVEAGTDAPGNPPNNDIAAAQALTMATVGQSQELALLAGQRPLLTAAPPTDVVRSNTTVAANAGTYLCEVIAMGVVLTP